MKEAIGADLLLELLTHTIQRSGRYALIYELKAIEGFLSDASMTGKRGYTFVTWQVVVGVIASPPPTNESDESLPEADDNGQVCPIV